MIVISLRTASLHTQCMCVCVCLISQQWYFTRGAHHTLTHKLYGCTACQNFSSGSVTLQCLDILHFIWFTVSLTTINFLYLIWLSIEFLMHRYWTSGKLFSCLLDVLGRLLCSRSCACDKHLNETVIALLSSLCAIRVASKCMHLAYSLKLYLHRQDLPDRQTQQHTQLVAIARSRASHSSREKCAVSFSHAAQIFSWLHTRGQIHLLDHWRWTLRASIKRMNCAPALLRSDKQQVVVAVVVTLDLSIIRAHAQYIWEESSEHK